MVGITIVYTGLVPQKITMLGLTFGEADRRSLLFILALVILYFWAAFAIYGLADFLAWRHAHSNARWPEVAHEFEKRWRNYRSSVRRAEGEGWPDTPESQWFRGERKAAEAEEQLEEERKRLRKEYADTMLGVYSRLAPGVSFVRAFFEFLLPLLVGHYAIYALVGPTAA